MNEYVVRVRCSRATLFAFLLEGDQRFITFDDRPRMMTRDDALEIQRRLPAGPGDPVVSIEKVLTHETSPGGASTSWSVSD